MSINGIGCHATSSNNAITNRQPESASSVQQFENALNGTQSSSSCSNAPTGSDQTDAASGEQSDMLSQLMEMLLPLLEKLMATVESPKNAMTDGQQEDSSSCEACTA